MDKRALRTESAKHWFVRIWPYIISRPIKLAGYIYANPSVLIPIAATFSGILLSAGMSLFLSIISADKVQKPGTTQYLGLTLIFGAFLYTWVVWSAQHFLDYLRDSLDKDGKPKDRFPYNEKRDDFELWKGRRSATWSICLGIAFIAAFIILIFVLGALSAQRPPANPSDFTGPFIASVR